MERYASAGARRFFVQLSPIAVPTELRQWLIDRGARPYNNWVKLYRDVSAPPAVKSDLSVRQIDTESAGKFAAIVSSCLDWPERVRPWIARTVGRPGWRHYMAFDGRRAVATAALFVQSGFGWLDFAATLPEYRGRGAQGALVVRRIEDAAKTDVSHLVVETAEQTPGRPAPSWRNMNRFSFEMAYVRPNYLCTVP
jgi:hypothetical protein